MCNIYIIGFMGVGKTTLGKALATRMRMRFIDLDALVEEQEEATVSYIFSEKGEDAFRTAETKALDTCLTKNNCIIATGGGTPCYNNNMEKMNKNGITLYLKAAPKYLAKRLSYCKHSRPLIMYMDFHRLMNYLKYILPEREKHYMQAKIVVNLTELISRDHINEQSENIHNQIINYINK